MDRIDRALDWLIPLARTWQRLALVGGLLAGIGGALTAGVMSGSAATAIAVGASAMFAAVAAAVVGLLGSMLAGALDRESRMWGLGISTFAVAWLIHPALLLLPPGLVALAIAPVSAAASALLGRFAGQVIEAVARP